MNGTTKILKLEANKPLTALVIAAEPAISKFGNQEQVKITFEGGNLLYMPAAAARIIAAGNAYTICKKQIKEGFKATYDVKPAEPEPEPAPVRSRPGDTRLHVEPVYDDGEYGAPPPEPSRITRDPGGRPIAFPPPATAPGQPRWGEPPQPPLSPLEQKLARSVEVIAQAKAAAEAAAKAPSPSRLTAALCAAVDAAGHASAHALKVWGVTLVFDAEMITRFGITAYIQNAKSTQ